MLKSLFKILAAQFRDKEVRKAEMPTPVLSASGQSTGAAPIFEDVRVYLPKFLSTEKERDLFESLKDFPENLDSRLYSDRCRQQNEIYQGDGLRGLPAINLPDTTIKNSDSVIISNSCDISTENTRPIPISVCYCPILKISNLEIALASNGIAQTRISSLVGDIRKQRISQILYLPKGGKLEEDSFILFDKICNCASTVLPRVNISDSKIFSFSDYGFYLFLIKLSIHFTRIREYLNRS